MSGPFIELSKAEHLAMIERAEQAERKVNELEEELYGEEGIRSGQIAHLNDAIRIQADRAVRAEVRLREMRDELWRWQRARDSWMARAWAAERALRKCMEEKTDG